MHLVLLRFFFLASKNAFCSRNLTNLSNAPQLLNIDFSLLDVYMSLKELKSSYAQDLLKSHKFCIKMCKMCNIFSSTPLLKYWILKIIPKFRNFLRSTFFKKHRFNPSYYPISIICVSSKLLENKFVTNGLNNYLDINNLISVLFL